MSAVFGQTARNLLEAAMIREKPVETLGNALWLYVRLLVGSNYRGMLSRHIDNLAADLSVTAERLDRWLKRLTEAGLIEVQSPAPFLVIKLGMWSDSDPESNDSQRPAYSYPAKPLHKELLKESYSQPGAASASSEHQELMQDILGTLRETDAASFRKAIELYSPSIIRAALLRVRRAQDIRKSRTALFRHLLPRIAREYGQET